MTTALQNRTAATRPAPFVATPRKSILMMLIDTLANADGRFREARRMDRLDPAARRDMGLPPFEQRALSDYRFLTVQW